MKTKCCRSCKSLGYEDTYLCTNKNNVKYNKGIRQPEKHICSLYDRNYMELSDGRIKDVSKILIIDEQSARKGMVHNAMTSDDGSGFLIVDDGIYFLEFIAFHNCREL